MTATERNREVYWWQERSKRVRVDFDYRGAHGRIKAYRIEIQTLHDIARYRPFAGERAIHADLEQAKYCAFRARSLVAFVDALDVKRSASRGGLIRMAKRAAHRVGWHQRPGFDHSRTWYRPSGYIRGGWADCEYLFSTEPYVDVAPVEAFCSAIGWPLYLCRPGIGLWHPAGGTRLILISPPGRGLPLEEIGPLVDAALPEWEGC